MKDTLDIQTEEFVNLANGTGDISPIPVVRDSEASLDFERHHLFATAKWGRSDFCEEHYNCQVELRYSGQGCFIHYQNGDIACHLYCALDDCA